MNIQTITELHLRSIFLFWTHQFTINIIIYRLMGKVKTFYETETCLQKFCERRSIQLGTDRNGGGVQKAIKK